MRPDPAPNPLIAWWESRSTRSQALIALPALMVLLFLVNLGPFNQPLWRSTIYGLFEGGVLGGLLLVVTAQEKAKRASGGGAGAPEQDQERAAGHQREGDHDPEDLDRQA